MQTGFESILALDKVNPYANRPERQPAKLIQAYFDQVLMRAEDGFRAQAIGPGGQCFQIPARVGVVVGKLPETQHPATARLDGMPESGRIAQPAKRRHGRVFKESNGAWWPLEEINSRAVCFASAQIACGAKSCTRSRMASRSARSSMSERDEDHNVGAAQAGKRLA